MVNDFLSPVVCGAAYLFPALPADPNCIEAPKRSQLNYLFIAPCTAVDPFELSGSAAVLVSSAIDNTNADNTKTRQLLGEGGIPEHEATEVEAPNRKILILDDGRGYELTFKVIVTNALVYAFLQRMQSGWLDFRFWYQDLGGFLYGKVLAADATTFGGIRPLYVNVQFPKGEGRDDLQYANVIIRWDADADPPRYVSPVTPADSCVPA